LAAHERQGLQRILRFEYTVAFVDEQATQELAIDRMVIDDKNGTHVLALRRARQASSSPRTFRSVMSFSLDRMNSSLPFSVLMPGSLPDFYAKPASPNRLRRDNRRLNPQFRLRLSLADWIARAAKRRRGFDAYSRA
jgi:hypothetical protein